MKTYNHNNYHSGINWVPPASLFRGEDATVLTARKAVLEAARAKNPRRWINLNFSSLSHNKRVLSKRGPLG